MPVSGSADSGSNPSLFSSLRSFWSVLVAVLCARLDLATLELEESGAYAVQLVVVTLAAILCIAMTVFFFLFFLVVVFWAHAAIVLGIIFTAGILASLALVVVTRQMFENRPKFLGQTLAELRRDVEGLRVHVNAKETPS